MDLELLKKVAWVPVRHHSPRTTAVLAQLFERVRPQLVLIECPEDAEALLPVLCDPQTQPPVAILGYRTDGVPGSSLWPFAAYSPEFEAMRWARAHDVPVRFIDIATGAAIASERNDEEGDDPSIEEEEVAAAPSEDRGARARRWEPFRSFEEFWEARFESPDYRPEHFHAALLGWAEVVRLEDRDERHRIRDAFMARHVLRHVAEGVPPEKIAVVVGAAHAAAFLAGDVDFGLLEKLPRPLSTSVTVIPYSFPRLAEQLGYGAGNRAPQYYQRAWDAGCDFHRATLEVLLEFSNHLRLRGFVASLADTLEAYRLAVTLATMREKPAPGLDEVREATIATLCRGDATHVDGFLWRSVIGHKVGHVASKVGKNSLQEEFWRELRERRLPESDSPETFNLRLNNDVEIGTSTFLHRLRVAEIPYATYQLTQQRGAAKGANADSVGGYAALTRVKEAWTAQWTPSTDIGLVEKIVLGDSLEQVATRVLQERLEKVQSTGEAADVLLESVIAGCPMTINAALRVCDSRAATDSDLPSLARAASALSALVSYGSSRSKKGDELDFDGIVQAIPELLDKTFERALLRVADAAACAPDAVAPVLEGLRTLHEVALSQPRADKAGWLEQARGLMGSHVVNPAASGLATGLLYIARELSETEVSDEVSRRLSLAVEPGAAAAFIEGFLTVNALVLVKNREVVKALDDYLCSVEPEAFRQTLPVLRRALGMLGQTERRYLMENVVGLRSLQEQGRAVKAVMEERDKEKLKEMSSDLGKALDDLDDLL